MEGLGRRKREREGRLVINGMNGRIRRSMVGSVKVGIVVGYQ